MVADEHKVPEGEWRCDVCTVPHRVSPIRWTYRTADSLSAEQRERLLSLPGPKFGIVWEDPLPGETPGFVFQDPEWAVCQPCHELICDGDLHALIARNEEIQWSGMLVIGADAKSQRAIEGLIREAKEASAAILTAFWTHRVGDPEPVS